MSIERKDTVYSDYIVLISPDGSWDKESLQPEMHVPSPEIKDEKYLKYVESENMCVKAVFDAYVNGSLDTAGVTALSDPLEDDGTVKALYFALRAADIPDDAWEALSTYGQTVPCIYSGCLPVSHLRMRTYRDNCGCVGRSWETFLVEGLSSSGTNLVYNVRKEHGGYAAALAVLKLYGFDEADPEIAKFEGLDSVIAKSCRKATA